ncbi:hypothetical protein HZB88_03205 [archaeon]|nr:hypothetical protein [archaeon]
MQFGYIKIEEDGTLSNYDQNGQRFAEIPKQFTVSYNKDILIVTSSTKGSIAEIGGFKVKITTGAQIEQPHTILYRLLDQNKQVLTGTFVGDIFVGTTLIKGVSNLKESEFRLGGDNQIEYADFIAAAKEQYSFIVGGEKFDFDADEGALIKLDKNNKVINLKKATLSYNNKKINSEGDSIIYWDNQQISKIEFSPINFGSYSELEGNKNEFTFEYEPYGVATEKEKVVYTIDKEECATFPYSCLAKTADGEIYVKSSEGIILRVEDTSPSRKVTVPYIIKEGEVNYINGDAQIQFSEGPLRMYGELGNKDIEITSSFIEGDNLCVQLLTNRISGERSISQNCQELSYSEKVAANINEVYEQQRHSLQTNSIGNFYGRASTFAKFLQLGKDIGLNEKEAKIFAYLSENFPDYEGILNGYSSKYGEQAFVSQMIELEKYGIEDPFVEEGIRKYAPAIVGISKLLATNHLAEIETLGDRGEVEALISVKEPTLNLQETDCISFCWSVFRETYPGTGKELKQLAVEASKPSAIADATQSGVDGINFVKALQKRNWKTVYYNPNVKNPEDKDEEHKYSYALAKQEGTYYRININDLLTDYKAGSIEANNKLAQLKKVPFAYVLARGGRHIAAISYGNIYEVHWVNGPGNVKLMEKSSFEKDWPWLSGVIVLPPDAWKIYAGTE